MRVRFLIPFFVLATALAASTASAQTPPAWDAPTGAEAPTPPDDERPPSTMHHVVREKLLVTGVTFLAVAYAGSIAWASLYLATFRLGPASCNDQYAGWHFVPVVGPVLGMLSGASCIHDSLHFEEGLLPVFFSLTQVVGLILTIVGAVGRDVDDAPQFAFSADANGGYVSLRGSF
jgi:hypothetical protein